MSFEVTNPLSCPATQPYPDSWQDYTPSSDLDENVASTEPLQNDQTLNFALSPIKRELLQHFPSPFIHLMQKAALINSQELDDLIGFIIRYLELYEDQYPLNFFDQSLSLVLKNDLNKARDVLRLQIAISKLQLFCFFNEYEIVLKKIEAKLKDSKRLIEHITAFLNPNLNPSLRDIGYMPIYECLLALEDAMFVSFYQRCLYNLQWQQNSEAALKKAFYEKAFNLIAHGIGYAKRGLRNLANLILEGELRRSIAIGPIGKPEASALRSFTSAAHGPFFLITKNCHDTLHTHKKHLAYIVMQPIDKELLIAIINIAFFKNLISEDQKKLSIARIFTMQEFLDLPDLSISSNTLEKHIQMKLTGK